MLPKQEVLTTKIGRFLKFMKIPLILRKIFENMAIESGSLPPKVGEFTCMYYEYCSNFVTIVKGES
jgi:hypothetical protein